MLAKALLVASLLLPSLIAQSDWNEPFPPPMTVTVRRITICLSRKSVLSLVEPSITASILPTRSTGGWQRLLLSTVETNMQAAL